MTDDLCRYVCKRCAVLATVEELTSFMSVVACEGCGVAEALAHSAPATLDHFFMLPTELKN